MTREEKRIKIAEACGLGSLVGFQDQRHIPDYFGNLDVMHDAEEWLRRSPGTYQPGGIGHYFFKLKEVCEPSKEYWRATAEQRAEAFGLALGLWKEGE